MILGKFRPISDRKEFSRVYQNAKKWHCEYANIYFLESPTPKFAAVASKKIGKAVARNRTKRVLRAVFCSVNSGLKDGIYVFIAKSSLEKTSFEEIKKSIKWSLKKVDSL